MFSNAVTSHILLNLEELGRFLMMEIKRQEGNMSICLINKFGPRLVNECLRTKSRTVSRTIMYIIRI